MAKKEKDIIDSWTNNRITVFLTATSYTIAMIAIIGIGSYYLDHYLGTFPVIFIIGLVAGFPITQFVIYKKFKKFAKKELEK